MNKKLGFLRRNAYKMNESTRILYYKSLVQPHIDYCSFTFKMMDKKLLDRMGVIQNKFLRAIKLKKNKLKMELLMKEMNIVNIDVRVTVNILKSIKRLINNQLPKNLVDRLKFNRDVRSRNLRYGDKLAVPNYMKSLGQKSLFYSGLKNNNELLDFVNSRSLNNSNFVKNCILFLEN